MAEVDSRYPRGVERVALELLSRLSGRCCSTCCRRCTQFLRITTHPGLCRKQHDHEQLKKDLSGPGRVATVDDIGGNHVCGNEVAPRLRAVQLDLADAEERGLHSVERR